MILSKANDARPGSPAIYINMIKRKPKATKVYDTYWKFAKNRQDIFYERLERKPYPWTSDSILNSYKFTNVYRCTDRISQYLIKNVIQDKLFDVNDTFFRILIFKIFNRIATWESLENEFGEISLANYSFRNYSKLLGKLMKDNKRIYSAAYIMASGKGAFGYEKKHQNHLKLVEEMIKDNVPLKIQECANMQEAYDLLLRYPTIGTFLSYQYVTDINYSELTQFSEMEFVKAGPGAKDGILKCFSDLGDYSFEDLISMVADTQEEEFAKRGLIFKKLHGRPLQLIDCQNVFCEVDKYARIAHPEMLGKSGRSRIKQKFKPNETEPINFCFPTKWNLPLNQ